MDRNRYADWMTVWKWFAAIDRTKAVKKEDWNELYNLLNGMWQEDRANTATPEELAAHAAAFDSFKQ